MQFLSFPWHQHNTSYKYALINVISQDMACFLICFMTSIMPNRFLHVSEILKSIGFRESKMCGSSDILRIFSYKVLYPVWSTALVFCSIQNKISISLFDPQTEQNTPIYPQPLAFPHLFHRSMRSVNVSILADQRCSSVMGCMHFTLLPIWNWTN